MVSPCTGCDSGGDGGRGWSRDASLEGGGPALVQRVYDASVVSFDGTVIAFTMFHPALADINFAGPLELDPIVFLGLGRQPAGSGVVQLVNDQLTPLRGFGRYQGELVGVSVQLEPGDTVGLLVFGFHPQYVTSFSRVPTQVFVAGEVEIPLP